ncbi:MAG TPA: 16S rRNA (adenine(1518)-N(6)/adenine(1519)-N(6))-dimethyltransferase RsmA [Candidatus Norongarragalinales archaeon]|jgi:16S rRNA (adenine1518-N6/adenine1519-N6)-dimethyltransferase|nr:16S rRNA (adenine(1518)-N(6)/adenine(1519)-N(6))-dimethyltransferase RsmA [Candidatus Norongarragalinales archaeon]
MGARLGQHFLIDEGIAKNIAALLTKKEAVVEVGAGTGALTKQLASRAKKVVALELDDSLLPSLRANTGHLKNVEIVMTDALDHDFSGSKNVFGNIPYEISSPLLFKIIETKSVELAVLMVQKEFGERLFARPGRSDYSRLSVMVQSKMDARLALTVPRFAFSPMPRVDSVVVLLKRKAKPVPVDAGLVNALFQHKNQTVRNALVHSAHLFKKEKSELRDMVKGHEFAEKKVRELSLEQISALCVFLRKRVG